MGKKNYLYFFIFYCKLHLRYLFLLANKHGCNIFLWMHIFRVNFPHNKNGRLPCNTRTLKAYMLDASEEPWTSNSLYSV